MKRLGLSWVIAAGMIGAAVKHKIIDPPAAPKAPPLAVMAAPTPAPTPTVWLNEIDRSAEGLKP